MCFNMTPSTSRHLIWFSYIGTRFCGVQGQQQHITVQEVIHNALASLLRVPSRDIRMGISSRTDSGVHALMNTALVELPNKGDTLLGLKPLYDGEKLTSAMNKLLSELDLEVRILRARQVAHGFCARRHVYKRMYLYRLAVLKPEFYRKNQPVHILAPLIELNRSWPIGSKFDPRKFREACKLFLGEQNMASFMISDTGGAEEKSPMRYIDFLDVDKGRCLLDAEIEPRGIMFDYYDVTVVSRSFIYRQIRKMMSMLRAVAAGHLELKELEWLLKNPHKSNNNRYNFRIAPPGGLYLKHILYRERDFDDPKPVYAHAWDEAPERDGGTEMTMGRE